MYSIRDAQKTEVNDIAALWHVAWHDAHAEIIPEELVRLRTLTSFVQRTGKHLANFRIAVGAGIDGLCMVRDDELYQLFVSAEARGSGLAKLLVDDAECLILANGYSSAWLSCAIGNERAAAFYRKCGWVLRQTIVERIELVDGVFPLECWKFEKDLQS